MAWVVVVMRRWAVSERGTPHATRMDGRSVGCEGDSWARAVASCAGGAREAGAA